MEGQSQSVKEGPSFPYPTDADDHCESPIDSYQDVLPLLRLLRGNRQPDAFAIYDPYFCDGAVKENFAKLGFPNVYNQKEDCYSIWSDVGKYPMFDVFVTNPPYSGDHIEKLMKHVTSKEFGNRPWFLLMPNWVHKKDYFLNLTKSLNVFYIVPKKRYVYIPPQNFRESKRSDVHKKSSPFVSMWYIYGGNEAVNNKLIQHFIRSESAASCDLARSKSALRDLRRKNR
ncbi:hypothetical protein FisN_23Lh218 [Fistulifera solaris]|uniref:Uncharacterized protein n=1 Tax=Fistulifera solaris TaxID=1519565 RepID=A0A1Z5JRJ8_FISSO|nr:hypothetical protein FisN_23Lh218 [Fistulifera solaris]|eukprot:GAX16653.1 hypothetical protein FisN_23Lh218 [Fistulifera solaris]